MNETEFLAEWINKNLAGTTIRNAVITEDKEGVGFQVVRKVNGRGNYEVLNVWVERDPEGNGSGWLIMEGAS